MIKTKHKQQSINSSENSNTISIANSNKQTEKRILIKETNLNDFEKYINECKLKMNQLSEHIETMEQSNQILYFSFHKTCQRIRTRTNTVNILYN